MAQSAAEQYRKALESAESIKQAAVDELKKQINGQIEELNSFGFDYRLSRSAGATRGPRAPSTKEKFCKICNIAGHDSRNHRNQEPQKKFTRSELEQRGLTTA